MDWSEHPSDPCTAKEDGKLAQLRSVHTAMQYSGSNQLDDAKDQVIKDDGVLTAQVPAPTSQVNTALKKSDEPQEEYAPMP